MRQIILSLLLLSSLSMFGQSDDVKKRLITVNIGYGMNMSLESLNAERAEEEGIAKTGFTWLDMSGRLKIMKYLNLDLGFTLSHFKDKLPFTQAVVFTSGSLSGLPSNAKSSLSSGSIYYSAGVNLPISSKVQLLGSFGNRRFSAHRSISSCSDCKKTALTTKAGKYLLGGIVFPKDEGQFHLTYSHYLKSDFKNSISLGITLWY